MPIIVAGVALAFGLGSVVSHQFPGVVEKATMHSIRTLTPAEKKYSQVEKEALASVYSVRCFHKFLYGQRITPLTDHKPLLMVFSSKSVIPVHSANRLQRRALVLLSFDLDIYCRRTQHFGQTDALSFVSEHSTVEDKVVASLSTEDNVECYITTANRALPVIVSEIQAASRNEPIIKKR